MLIRDEMWDRIRDQFSESEKEKLRAQVTGTAICPRGCTIADEKLEQGLRDKLRQAIKTEESK